MKVYKRWKRTKGDTENLVDNEGNAYGHINKYKNEGWRAFIKTHNGEYEAVLDKATKKPKNFKDADVAKLIVESLVN